MFTFIVLWNACYVNYYQEIRGCYERIFFLQNSDLIRMISFKCMLYVFEEHLYEEKIDRKETIVAPYIRLEFSLQSLLTDNRDCRHALQHNKHANAL